MERPIIKESDICDEGGYLLNPKFVAEKINKIFHNWAEEMEEKFEMLECERLDLQEQLDAEKM